MSSPKTRDNDAFLRIFGVSPCLEDKKIHGCRLPTYQQVLLCYEANKKFPSERKPTKLTALRCVYDEVKAHYFKAGIPVKSIWSFQYDLEKLHNGFSAIRKNKTKKQKFTLDYSKTMPLWPKDTEKQMRNMIENPLTPSMKKAKIKEDLQFLESMMKDRIASYSSLDKINRKQSLKRKHTSQPSTSSTPDEFEAYISSSNSPSSGTEDTVFEENTDKSQPSSSRSHRRLKKTGTTLTLPFNFVQDERFVTAVRRTGTSSSHLQLLLSTLIEIGGGDKESVNISYSHIHRSINQGTQDISNKIQLTWQAPDHILVHFDDKLTNCLNNESTNTKEKRLPVVVTGGNETKLLGVPSLGSKLTNIYGATVCSSVLTLLEKWKCTDKVIGLVFDTTSCNTGHKTGACITIQRHIGRPLFWIPCRHHIGEMVLAEVWKSLQVEPSQAPRIRLFEKLKENWNIIVRSDCQLVSMSPVAEDLVNFYQSVKNKDFLRNDYQELIHLALMYVAGQ